MPGKIKGKKYERDGRPLELTHELIALVEDHLSRTYYLETVADLLGHHRKTFFRWAGRGEKELRRIARGAEPNPDEDIYVKFCHAIKRAEAWAEQNAAQLITQAAKSQWQAAAWLLERKFHEHWRKRDNDNNQKQPVIVQIIEESAKHHVNGKSAAPRSTNGRANGVPPK